MHDYRKQGSQSQVSHRSLSDNAQMLVAVLPSAVASTMPDLLRQEVMMAVSPADSFTALS